MSFRLGVVAGEASGDALGARVIHALRDKRPDLVVEGVGGPLMCAAGCRSLVPLETLSVMGLVEPFKRLPSLLSARRLLFQHFRDNPCDVFLGIDAPDFNLSLEVKLRKIKIPTAHLVSPSIWAWRKGRIRRIRNAVDKMFCLFPFESDAYEASGVISQVVGHPLADDIPDYVDREEARTELDVPATGRLVALLPGSRQAEIRAHAPLFLAAAAKMLQTDPLLQFVIPAASVECEAQLQRVIAQHTVPVHMVSGHAQKVLGAADAALVCAGTATLEAALLRRPMVVAYQTGFLSWALLSRLVRTPHVALPNLLAKKRLVPEFLQNAATPQILADAVLSQLACGRDDAQLMREFEAIHSNLKLGCTQQVSDALQVLAVTGVEA